MNKPFNLSEHDQKVLESLFVPFEGALPSPLNLDIEAEIKDDIPEVKTPLIEKSIKLELEGIRLTEERKLDEAISKFEKAIEVAPSRSSVYNNKAQALRLKGDDDGALKYLNRALELSSQQARTRCQALCQRGLLYRKMENISAAKDDFEEASKLGSRFARNQLVEINPYSALCNQMLQAAFQKLQ
ncbi:tetratricopeptide repeat protein 36 homolog [Episyrphus balteatus]|uniref:tetratricopeptide repeat protein 36 homolog n=1 Tax=Episyrphus balteatus TaxID=286459 RepID=UPI002486843E|nr:tetratricopeptide repeat protein 36 homolog [Episyrphus balteatus]